MPPATSNPWPAAGPALKRRARRRRGRLRHQGRGRYAHRRGAHSDGNLHAHSYGDRDPLCLCHRLRYGFAYSNT